MKIEIDWKKALVFLLVIAGLVIISRLLGLNALGSLLFTLGVMLLLLVGDHFAQGLDDKLKRRKEERHEDE